MVQRIVFPFAVIFRIIPTNFCAEKLSRLLVGSSQKRRGL
jgi:hypothetical protein